MKVDFGSMDARVLDKKISEMLYFQNCQVFIEAKDKKWFESLFKKHHTMFNSCIFALFPREGTDE